MDSPDVVIARNWYKAVDLTYLGVDFGKCIEYDTLQIVNRSVLRREEERDRERTEAESNSTLGESHDTEPMAAS